MDDLLTALALLLVLEGLLPMAFPAAWKDAVRRASQLADGQLRMVGAVMVVTGLIALKWVRG